MSTWSIRLVLTMAIVYIVYSLYLTTRLTIFRTYSTRVDTCFVLPYLLCWSCDRVISCVVSSLGYRSHKWCHPLSPSFSFLQKVQLIPLPWWILLAPSTLPFSEPQPPTPPSPHPPSVFEGGGSSALLLVDGRWPLVGGCPSPPPPGTRIDSFHSCIVSRAAMRFLKSCVAFRLSNTSAVGLLLATVFVSHAIVWTWATYADSFMFRCKTHVPMPTPNQMTVNCCKSKTTYHFLIPHLHPNDKMIVP